MSLASFFFVSILEKRRNHIPPSEREEKLILHSGLFFVGMISHFFSSFFLFFPPNTWRSGRAGPSCYEEALAAKTEDLLSQPRLYLSFFYMRHRGNESLRGRSGRQVDRASFLPLFCLFLSL